MPDAGRHAAAGSHGTIQLRDGRALGYVEYGDPTGPGLLYFHGHPGSRLEAKFLAPAATQADVRLIGIDRPGMGLSTYQPRRRLLDWVEDVEQLADHRAIDRFSVVGFSGGGPYAAACAYRIPHRLNACGLVASVGHVGRRSRSWPGGFLGSSPTLSAVCSPMTSMPGGHCGGLLAAGSSRTDKPCPNRESAS
jgi:pimeloyl-ACP methyl ester carboxylesterase